MARQSSLYPVSGQVIQDIRPSQSPGGIRLCLFETGMCRRKIPSKLHALAVKKLQPFPINPGRQRGVGLRLEGNLLRPLPRGMGEACKFRVN